MPMVMSGPTTSSIIFLQLGAPMAVVMTMSSFLPMLVFTVSSLLIPKIYILSGSFE